MRILSRHNVNVGFQDLARALKEARQRPEQEVLETFERQFADYLGTDHAVATGNGRSALYLALKALDLPKGTPVGVPAYAFYAIPAVVEALGLRPIHVPMDMETYAIDATKLDAALPEHTGALVIIQPFGQSADMDAVLDVCDRRGIPLIEDASQSIGAAYRERKLGTFGVAGVFSLVPGKNMTAGGGGMLVTSDALIARRAREILERSGAPPARTRPVLSVGAQRLLTSRTGFALALFPAFLALSTLAPERLDKIFEEAQVPFDPAIHLTRMTACQAAIGRTQLAHLDRLNDIRRRNAEALLACLRGTPGIQSPRVVRYCSPTFNAFPIRVEGAREVRRALLRHGIDTREDYMRWFDGTRSKRDEVLYLPNHPGLTSADMVHVANTLRRIMEARNRR